MDGESLRPENHDCPPSPAPVLSGSQMTHQVTHHGCRCSRHAQEVSQLQWGFTDPWKSLLPHCVHWIKTHPEVIKEAEVFGYQSEQLAWPQLHSIWAFSQEESVTFPFKFYYFSLPCNAWVGGGFLGTFHAWFILRVLRRKGETVPLIEVTEDTTTSSLLIQMPSRQRVHVRLPTMSQTLVF